MRRTVVHSICGFAAVSVVLASGVAHATDYTLNTTAMTEAWDGKCSLVEAINASNSLASYYECPAGTGTDTILLGSGTYTSNWTLWVFNNVTIFGLGRAQTTIAGNFASNPQDQLFAVYGSLTLNSLTVRNNTNNNSIYTTGIAVWHDAYLNSDDGLRVTGWTRSGIRVTSGSVHLLQAKIDANTNKYPSSFWNHGGGISVIDDDVPPADHQIRLINSLVANNSANGNGGGLHFNSNGAAQLRYTTFTNNTAERGGGIYIQTTSTAYFESSHLTIAKNTARTAGGGVEEHHAGALLSFDGAIVANNTAPTGANLVRTSLHGEAIDSVWGAGVTSASLGCNNPNWVCTRAAFGVDAKFGPLMTMGGPHYSNEVLPLLKGSPAIDWGTTLPADAVDQRGLPGTQDGDDNGSSIPDAGAFEKNLRWQAENELQWSNSSGDFVNLDFVGYPSGQMGRFLQANAVNDFVTYVIGIPEAGTYNVTVKYKRASDGGKFRVGTSNNPSSGFTEFASEQNGYSSSVTFPAAVSMGSVSFAAAGKYYIRFRVSAKGTGNGFNLFNDYVKVTKTN